MTPKFKCQCADCRKVVTRSTISKPCPKCGGDKMFRPDLQAGLAAVLRQHVQQREG